MAFMSYLNIKYDICNQENVENENFGKESSNI